MSSYNKRSLFVTVIMLVCMIAVTTSIALAKLQDDILDDVQVPVKTDIETAKKSIVLIQTGYSTKSGFKKVKESSGFIVSNNNGEVFIITTAHGVDIGDSSGDMTKTIRVIVRGDVASELTEYAVSKKQDFVVLQSEDVLKEKGEAVFLDNDIIDEISSVTEMYFPLKGKKKTSSIQYEAKDVLTNTESLINSKTINNTICINYSGSPKKASDGGVLVNENGIVVGMIDYGKSNGESCSAISITEIEKVLDNYGVNYSTDKIRNAYSELYYLAEDALKQDASDNYTAESKSSLERELEKAASTLSESPYDLDALLASTKGLENAQKQLKTKVDKLFWIVGLLLIVIVFLSIRLVSLIRWRKKTISDDLFVEDPAAPSIGTSETIIKAVDSHTSTENSNENEFLRNMPGSKIRLYWIRKKEHINVEKIDFVIGTKKELVDLYIDDNKLVSRMHASIHKSEQGFIIYDLNSSNGSFVNEKTVSDSGIMLKQDDFIRLADEEFMIELI